MRSPSFRLAKDSVRFCWFWASSTPETKRRGEPYPSNEIFEMETEVATKLHESAANPLKSLVRVNLCVGGWGAPKFGGSWPEGSLSAPPPRHYGSPAHNVDNVVEPVNCFKLWRRGHIEFERRHSGP
jgi:hypothetical protein